MNLCFSGFRSSRTRQGGCRIGMALRHILPMRIDANGSAYPHIFKNICAYLCIFAHYPHHSAFAASAWPSLAPMQAVICNYILLQCIVGAVLYEIAGGRGSA